MTTQQYLPDMQTLSNASGQQVNQVQQQNSSQQMQHGSSQKPVQSHPVLQPTQPSYAGQQFIVTIAGEQNEDHENMQLSHNDGQVIYQPQQNYNDYSQSTMYTSVTGSYYQGSGVSSQMSSGNGSVPGQLVMHGGDTYIVQGGVMGGEGQGVAHTIRAAPASVQWLIDNYETAEGVSLPRSTLYNHYLRHCQEQKLDPMNPASFGKLIRSVFLGLRTRRLGTRGNSQYHYYGIRIKSMSPLNQLTNDQLAASRQHSLNQVKRFKSPSDGQESNSSITDSSPSNQLPPTSIPTTQQQQHQQFLGDASGAIPDFGHISLATDQLPPGVTEKHLVMFEMLYRDHCEAFLEIVVNLQFPLIETLWMSFWRKTQEDPDCDDMEQRLPKDKLLSLCEVPAIRQYVRRSDYAFYQSLVQVLIPDVLRPIPSSLTQNIRNFAKSLEGWLKKSMAGVPDEMIKTKVGAVSAFAQILRRYTSLNHLAQAARAVLQNSAQISQMLADINKVDFVNVQEQASWVCQCDDAIVHQLEQDFKKTLQHQTSLEQWASWLEEVVNKALSLHESSPDFPKAARQFLLKWSFYSSMVIRDLTLRSAASFGSFHLIRLLYDEYMFYLVEHKVAAATGETSIAVMGEVRQLIDMGALAMGGVASDSLQPVQANSNTYAPPPPPPPVRDIESSGNGSAASRSDAPISLVTSSVPVTTNPGSFPTYADPVRVRPSVATVSSFQSQGTVSISAPQQQPQQQHRVTLMTSTVTSAQPNKTIVVMPVLTPVTGANAGAQQTIKRIKTD